MAAHLEPGVKQVVLLVGGLRALLHLLQLQHIPALLSDLRDADDPELKAARTGIVLHHFSSEA